MTCNNVILKYIEDDIVLSMNIKSITLDSCNSNWIPDIIGKYITIIIHNYSFPVAKRT